MELQELGKHAKQAVDRLREHYKFTDEEKFILAQVVKLNEETGELAEKILGQFNLQRKAKLKESKKDLPAEFADVIIVTAMIAEAMDIDITEAVKKKLTKNKARKL